LLLAIARHAELAQEKRYKAQVNCPDDLTKEKGGVVERKKSVKVLGIG
jgi:hypothetical protein